MHDRHLLPQTRKEKSETHFPSLCHGIVPWPHSSRNIFCRVGVSRLLNDYTLISVLEVNLMRHPNRNQSRSSSAVLRHGRCSQVETAPLVGVVWCKWKCAKEGLSLVSLVIVLDKNNYFYNDENAMSGLVGKDVSFKHQDPGLVPTCCI